MADFKKAYAITREFEGGYSNHPQDAGGETYKGIARKRNPKWRGWQIVDSMRNKPDFPQCLDASEPLQHLVHDLYKTDYWNVCNLDKCIDQDIAEEVFDTCVNMGESVAAVFLQRVINVSNRNGKDFSDIDVDGHAGPVTIGALNAIKERDRKNVWLAYNALKGARYIEICERNPSQEVFFHGWMKRVFNKK